MVQIYRNISFLRYFYYRVILPNYFPRYYVLVYYYVYAKIDEEYYFCPLIRKPVQIKNCFLSFEAKPGSTINYNRGKRGKIKKLIGKTGKFYHRSFHLLPISI